MDAVSYPESELISFLNENFECLKINEKAASESEKELMCTHRMLWSPAFILLDHRGNEVRKMTGFRRASELIAEAAVALGKASLLHRNPPEAARWFDFAYRSLPRHEVAPEALYWLAIAEFRASKDKDVLWAIWEQLRQEYPDSRWATSSDCRDYPPSVFKDAGAQ